MDQNLFGDEIFTLTDEEGNENQFEILGREEIDGEVYFALFPAGGEEDEEYVILKLATEDGEEVLVTIDDDDEFEKVAAVFDDALFGEVDYDAEEE